MKIAWTNDLHMEFLDGQEEAKFLRKLEKCKADVLLIAGDIAQAPSIKHYLPRLSNLPMPIYFVLGNHDYYKGNILETRQGLHSMLTLIPNLHWLNESGVVKLTEDVALIGHDGWADGRFGTYETSFVQLNDFRLIRDLDFEDKTKRLKGMQKLADEAADHFRSVLQQTAWAKHIIVVTHVPPWDRAAWHRGKYSDPDFMPFFSSKVVGEVLEGHMTQHLGQKMTVLCGHTHGGGKVQIMPNLLCLTGAAEYHAPQLQKLLTV